jgi:uncharacterized protein
MSKIVSQHLPEIISDSNVGYESASGQCDCDCDCACADTHLLQASLKKEWAFSDPKVCFVRSASNTPPLNDEYRYHYGLGIQPAVLNRAAEKLLQNFSQPVNIKTVVNAYEFGDKAHIESAIRRLIDFGLLSWEKNPTPAQETETKKSPDVLSAWLHISDQCNLHCAYCYLPHERYSMSLETGQTVIEAVFRSAQANGFKRIKLKYAGGEPLLHFDVVGDLHRYAQEKAQQTGISLDGVVLSNGTLLTQPLISKIQQLGLRLMISLDGLGAIHDRHRVYSGGKATSQDVIKAINLALANGLVPDISITVSGRTIEGLPELMKWVLERDLPFSLNFYRENDLSKSQTELAWEEEKLIAGMQEAFQVIQENLPQRNLLASLLDRVNLASPNSHTCGVGKNYLVFDPYGRVAKCQMQLGQVVTTTQTGDALGEIRNATTGIQNISVEEKEDCRSCEWKFWCTGGCPLAAYRATGRYDAKSPNCTVYKALLPDVLKLEGLRLLKYGRRENLL